MIERFAIVCDTDPDNPNPHAWEYAGTSFGNDLDALKAVDLVTDLGHDDRGWVVVDLQPLGIDPDNPAAMLSVLGRTMAELVGDDPPDDDEEDNVIALVHAALDKIDRAVEVLRRAEA